MYYMPTSYIVCHWFQNFGLLFNLVAMSLASMLFWALRNQGGIEKGDLLNKNSNNQWK